MDRYSVNIEAVESSRVVLTIEGLPRRLIFGRTREEALCRAREAPIFHLPAGAQAVEPPLVELVPRTAP